jgi:hypothetical protein
MSIRATKVFFCENSQKRQNIFKNLKSSLKQTFFAKFRKQFYWLIFIDRLRKFS